MEILGKRAEITEQSSWTEGKRGNLRHRRYLHTGQRKYKA